MRLSRFARRRQDEAVLRPVHSYGSKDVVHFARKRLRDDDALLFGAFRMQDHQAVLLQLGE